MTCFGLPTLKDWQVLGHLISPSGLTITYHDPFAEAAK